jgi:hypothetical protein
MSFKLLMMLRHPVSQGQKLQKRQLMTLVQKEKTN